MLNKYERYEIDYSQLGNFKFEIHNPFVLCINRNGVKYEFLIKINKDLENLLFIGSGSYNPDKFNPPVFQRHAWIEDFTDSVIFYNDPTLYLNKITLGWGNGTENRHYLKEISDIANSFIEQLNYKKKNVYFYGSSAGGFMSLMLAGFVKDTTAIVNNPQVFVLNFWPNPVREMLETSYPQHSREKVIEKFSNRIDVLEFYKSINYVPSIYYLQNASAKRDIDTQLLPFISGLKDFSDELFSNKVSISLYADTEKGHTPISKEETLNYINSVTKSIK